jgi:hypothetical protein
MFLARLCLSATTSVVSRNAAPVSTWSPTLGQVVIGRDGPPAVAQIAAPGHCHRSCFDRLLWPHTPQCIAVLTPLGNSQAQHLVKRSTASPGATSAMRPIVLPLSLMSSAVPSTTRQVLSNGHVGCPGRSAPHSGAVGGRPTWGGWHRTPTLNPAVVERASTAAGSPVTRC